MWLTLSLPLSRQPAEKGEAAAEDAASDLSSGNLNRARVDAIEKEKVREGRGPRPRPRAVSGPVVPALLVWTVGPDPATSRPAPWHGTHACAAGGVACWCRVALTRRSAWP